MRGSEDAALTVPKKRVPCLKVQGQVNMLVVDTCSCGQANVQHG